MSFWPEATRGAPPTRRYVHAQRFGPAGTKPDPLTWRRAVRDSRWKLISNGLQKVPNFYDLKSDPEELDDLMGGSLNQEQQQAFHRLFENLPR